MAIKFTLQGILIYGTMGAYLLAMAAFMPGRKKVGRGLFSLGFILACISLAYRWIHVRHVPMQNLFEVFLCLGAAVYPLSVFCRRSLGVASDAADTVIGVLLLFPAGFVFSGEPQHLPPALQCWLFAPHVAAYVLGYIFMIKAAVPAARQLAGFSRSAPETPPPEDVAYRMVCTGFPLLTLGLILGSYWGHLAWGDYWGWDPKESWSLASWLVYVGYFHFRALYGTKYPRLNSLWVLAGLGFIMMTLLWANLSSIFAGLHSYAL